MRDAATGMLRISRAAAGEIKRIRVVAGNLQICCTFAP